MIASQIHSAFGGGAAGFSHGGSGAAPSPRRVTGGLTPGSARGRIATRPLHPPSAPASSCDSSRAGLSPHPAWCPCPHSLGARNGFHIFSWRGGIKRRTIFCAVEMIGVRFQRP